MYVAVVMTVVITKMDKEELRIFERIIMKHIWTSQDSKWSGQNKNLF